MTDPQKSDSSTPKLAITASIDDIKEAFEYVNDGILITDHDGKIVYANQRAADIAGTTVAELCRSAMPELIHPDDWRCISARFKRQMEGKVVAHNYETTLIGTGGKTIDLELTASYFEWNQRDGIFTIIRDISEKKRTSELLKRSEESYRILVETTHSLIFRLDTKANFLYSNPAFISVLGYKPDQIFGTCGFDLVHPDDLDYILTSTENLFTRGEPVRDMVSRVMTAEGKPVWLSINATGLFDLEGNLVEIQGVAQDITERKHMEDAIRESEERWRALLENMPETVLTVDPDRLITFINRTLSGRPREEIIGTSLIDFITPEEKDVVTSRFQEVFEKGVSLHFESRAVIGERLNFNLWVSIAPLKKAGKITRAIVISTDITHLKNTEKALRDSEEMFRSLAEESPNMITINRREKLVYVNPKCEEVTGYSREELLSPDFSLLTILPPQYHTQFIENVQKHDEGIDIDPREYQLITRTGAIVDTVLTTTRISYQGEPAVLGVLTDITSRKKAEKELRRYADHLEEMVEERTLQIKELERKRSEMEKFAALGRVTAGIAHEIKNPLAGIRNSFLLLKDAIPEDHGYYNYVPIIEEDIELIGHIIDQANDIYNPSLRNIQPVDIIKSLDDVVAVLAPKIESMAVKVSRIVDISDPWVTLPETSFKQILINLVANAIEASSAGGTVELKVSEKGDLLVVKVIDYGEGMTEEVKKSLFEPFYTRKYEKGIPGSGLGLPMTKSLLDVMGGCIEFESELGRGTTFTIEIPKNRYRHEASHE